MVVSFNSRWPLDFLVIPMSDNASELFFISWSNFFMYFVSLSVESISEMLDFSELYLDTNSLTLAIIEESAPSDLSEYFKCLSFSLRLSALYEYSSASVLKA